MNPYFESEEFKNTLARYEESQRTGASCYFDSDDFVDFSDYYLEKNKPDVSLQVVEQGLQQHPDNGTLKCSQCGLLVYLHRFNEARSVLAELDDDYQLEKAYIIAQLTYAQNRDVEKADQLFHDWFKMLETDWDRQDEGEEDDAEDADNAIRDAYIHVMMSYVDLSDVEHDKQLKGWIESYVERYQPLGRHDSDWLVADIVRECEFVDLIITVFTSLLDSDPYMKDGWTVLAAAQHYNGELDDALNSLEFALAINPNDVDALSLKAHCYYEKNLFADAIHWFLEARPYDTYHLDDRYISYSYMMLEDVDNALIYLKSAEEGLDNFPEAATEAKGWALLEVAEQYLNCQHPKEALAVMKKVQKLLPKQKEVLMLKGTILLAMNQMEKALNTFSKYLELALCTPAALVHLGGLFLSYDHCDYAVPILEAALNYPEEYAEYNNRNEAYLYLALAYYKLNYVDESTEYLRLACEKCPEHVKKVFPNIPDTMPKEDYFDFIVKGDPSESTE